MFNHELTMVPLSLEYAIFVNSLDILTSIVNVSRFNDTYSITLTISKGTIKLGFIICNLGSSFMVTNDPYPFLFGIIMNFFAIVFWMWVVETERFTIASTAPILIPPRIPSFDQEPIKSIL